jgi:hypothetical protein
LVPGESTAAFDHFCAALRADLAPEGALEEALVDRIAGLTWRLRRVPWLEAGLLRAHAFENRRQRLLQHVLSTPPRVPEAARPRLDAERRLAQGRDNDLGRAFERTILRGDAVTTLARYETALDRALQRALMQLAGLQTRGARCPHRTIHLEEPDGHRADAREGWSSPGAASLATDESPC